MSGARSGSMEKIYECPAEGALLSRVQDALELIGNARSTGATLVLIPVSRLDPSFFELRTMLAGEMLQKFVIYQVRVAILGDTTAMSEESKSLRDFIREANRGASTWFVQNREELESRLNPAALESTDAAGS